MGRSPKQKKIRRWLAPVVLLLVILTAVLFRWKYQRYTIPDNGMFPTAPAGATTWVTRNPYRSAGDVLPGDVVLFSHQADGRQYDYVWRVVGRPGEHVVVTGDQVMIDGTELPRTRLRTEGSVEIFSEENGVAIYEVAYDADVPHESRASADLTVPEGHFFLMGDNRYSAEDSRYHGPVPFEAIFAKF